MRGQGFKAFKRNFLFHGNLNFLVPAPSRHLTELNTEKILPAIPPGIKQGLTRYNIGSRSLEGDKKFRFAWLKPTSDLRKAEHPSPQKIVALLRSELIWQPRCMTPTIHLVKLNHCWLAELVRSLNLT